MNLTRECGLETEIGWLRHGPVANAVSEPKKHDLDVL